MNTRAQNFMKYFYISFAVLFLGYFYWNAPLGALIFMGGISALMFIANFFLIFKIKPEKKLRKILRFIGIFGATMVLLLSHFLYIFFTANTCLSIPGNELFQNTFTKEVIQLPVGCGGATVPWWYTNLPWDDSRNPDPTARHYAPLNL